jgi:tight adherence protein C
MILFVIPALTALTFLALAATTYRVVYGSQRFTDRLHRMINADDTPTVGHGADNGDPLMDSSVPFVLKPFAFLGWLMPTQIASETLKWELAQAGYRHLESRKIFAGVRVVSTVVLGLGAAIPAWGMRLASNELFFLIGTAIALGYSAPMMFIRARQSRRQMEITLNLPDALDLLVICVEAGQGLNAALMKVGKETAFSSPALSEDLMMVNNEMRAGVARTQALRNFSLRTGVDDVRSLVAVMIQSDRFGTSVAQALRIHADSLRTKRRQRAEEKARKAPVKLVFPLVFCIFPELLVVLLAPGMLELFRALSQD